jgi:uncharacterized OB-fold protein
MSEDVRDVGYDDFLDAVEAGEPYYLESPSENGWLPPKTVDPETGERNLVEKDLPTTGEVLTYTITNVAGPSFTDDTPYVVAVAEFGPVNITGQVRGMDHDDVEIGQEVELSVGRNETADERVVVFEPV